MLPPATNSAQFMQMQNSHKTGCLATSDQAHPSTILTKVSHSLSSNAAGHPIAGCTAERRHLRRRDDDDDDTPSDLRYQTSTTSGSTRRNPTTEDSQNGSLSLTLYPPVASMQPRTASLLTVNHPVTLAVATVGNGEIVSFLDMHITCAIHQHNFVARIILVHFVI